MIAGKELKGAALARLESDRASAILKGRRALLVALLGSPSGEATADDVRGAVELGDGVSPKAFGCVPTALSRAGIIARAGFAESRRPEAHARPVSVWRLVDRAAAVRWLERNPAPVELTLFD